MEEAHLGPEAEWFHRKRADAIHDGESKNGTWMQHVEMLRDSFRDLEDSGCTLSEESKGGSVDGDLSV